MSNSICHSQMTLTSQAETFSKPPWWNRRTKLERTLLFVTITCLLMVSVMAVALSIFGYLHQKNLGSRQGYYLSQPLSDDATRKFCLTPGCVKAAAALLDNIDENIDPCQDFYQFSCGGWLEKHTIAEDKSATSVFSDTQDNLNMKLKVLMEKPIDEKSPSFIKTIKMMYDSCMDLKNIENLDSKPLQSLLDEMGGWPVVVGKTWKETNFDWIDIMAKFKKNGYSHDVLIDFSVIADFRNNSRHIIDLDQPTLGMPDRSYYLKDFNDTVTETYFRIMMKSAVKLGAKEATIKEELMEAFKFEKMLANFSLPREERRNISQLYNKYTLKTLQNFAPEVNWTRYFNALLDQELGENETIIVTVPSFIKQFSSIINTVDKRVLANYLMWRVVGMSISAMSQEWRKIGQEYTKALTGKNQEQPRWEQCLSSLTGTLGIALSSFYVRNHFKSDSKDSALEMVNYIHKEFKNILQNLDWMDEETRTQAIEKANSIQSYIGYPSELLNNTAVEDLYENLTLSKDSYFHNVMRVKKWATNYAFNQLRKPNIKGEWKKHAKAAVVNAFYNSLENSIEFPAGILQNWFFNKDRPTYMNFGAIGYVIGHEITHGFDDRGRQFDKNGNNVNWWDNKTDHHFKQKAQCIIDQYGNYTVPIINLNLNGINTQGENIADNGGIKESYKAYLAWVKDHGVELQLPGLKYTPNQLFWISAANVWCGKYKPESLKLKVITGAHSPAQFRVIGPFSNNEDFSKDFECSLGSPMNPMQKCQVW